MVLCLSLHTLQVSAASLYRIVNDNDAVTANAGFGSGEHLRPGEGVRIHIRYDLLDAGLTTSGGPTIDFELYWDRRDGCHLTIDNTWNSPNSQTRVVRGGHTSASTNPPRSISSTDDAQDVSTGEDYAIINWGAIYCATCTGSSSNGQKSVQGWLWADVPTTGMDPKHYQGPVGSGYVCTAQLIVKQDGVTVEDRSFEYYIVDTTLEVTKSGTTPGVGTVGETVQYTVVVSHPTATVSIPGDPTNSRLSFGNPGPITMTDVIPADLDLVVGSVTVSPTAIGASSITIVQGNTGGDTEVEVTIPSAGADLFTAGSSVTITYSCTLNTAKSLGDTVTNTASISYTGFEGASQTYSYDATSTITYGGFYFSSTSDPTTTKSEYSTIVDDLRPDETGSVVASLDMTGYDGSQDIKVRFTADTREGCEMGLSSPGVVLGSSVVATTNTSLSDGGGYEFLDTLTISLGNLDAQGGTPASNSFTGSFTTQLPNHPSIYSSDLKQDPVTLLWTACAITLEVLEDDVVNAAKTQTLEYEVVDVQLRIFKNLVGNNTAVDGGDVLTFSIDVSHVDSPEGDAQELSLAEAHDLIITDSLSSYLTLVPGSVTLSPSALGTITLGNGGSDTYIQVDLPTLAKADSPRITYQATLSSLAPAATKLFNTATVEATRSAFGNLTFTRNNTATILTSSPTAEFVILDSSLPETSTDRFSPNITDLAVGETVVIAIRLSLPEGVSTTNKFEVSFATAPGKLAYTGYELPLSSTLNISAETNITTNDRNGDGFTDEVFFDFGVISNTPDNIQNENDVFVVKIYAYVPDIPANANGVQTSFQGKVVFGLGDVVCYEVTWNEGKSSKILFPKYVPTKTAAQFYDYRDSYAHTGEEEWERALLYFVIDNTNSTAFVLVYDKPNGPGAPASHTNPAGGKTLVEIESDGLAGIGTVTLLEEDDNGSNICPIEKTNPALMVGGTDNYCWDDTTGSGAFRHSWNEQKTDGIVLGYFPNENWCMRLTWKPSFFWNNGAGDWDDYARLFGINEIALLSDDSSGVTQKTFFGLDEAIGLEVCGFSCNFAAGTLASRTETLKFEIMHPTLDLSTTANITAGDANDAIQHTVTLRHSPVGCVLNSVDPLGSCSPAYNVSLKSYFETVGPLVAGTLNINFSQGSNYTVTSDGLIDMYIPVFPTDEIMTMTFATLIKQSVQPAEVVDTLTNVTAVSALSSYSRPLNNVVNQAFYVLAPALVSLTVEDTSFAGTTSGAFNTTLVDLAVGETATFRINVLLPEATTNVSLLVELPRVNGKLEMTGSSLVSVGSQITWDDTNLPVGSPGIAQDLDGDGITDAVLFNMGTTVNLANNIISGSDEVDFEVYARVVDNLLNSDGKQLPLKATMFYSDRSVSASTFIEMVGPTLSITKSSDITTGDYSDTVTYTVTLTTSGSTDAYNVMVTDQVPTELTVNGGSATTTQGSTSITGNLVEIDVGTYTSGGGAITITYTADYNANSQALPQGGNINNTASVNYLVLPGEAYANRTASAQHSITVTHVCGNGATGAPETCDDGNTVAGDGCSATCTIEPGYVCNITVIPAVCVLCGDGTISGPETCDDGNTVAGDGCSSSCLTEPGWYCSGAPSTCVTQCGDGIVAGVEGCDDGNTIEYDCCSPTCTVEPSLCRCDNSGSPASPSACGSIFKCWTYSTQTHPLCCSLTNILGTCPDRAGDVITR